MSNIFEDFDKQQRDSSIKWLAKKEAEDAKNSSPSKSKKYSKVYITKFQDETDYFG